MTMQTAIRNFPFIAGSLFFSEYANILVCDSEKSQQISHLKMKKAHPQ